MLPIEIPTRDDLLALSAMREPGCVSMYLETTPVSQDVGASQIAFANAVREAMAQLGDVDLPRGAREAMAEHFDDLAEDDVFWAHQANTLAVLATPGAMKAYRLANQVTPTVQVADRFHLKPLLRALTFPHTGFLLHLSQNSARLMEFFADHPPVDVSVPHMPKDAANFAGKASLNDRSHSRRITGSEGKKVRLRQYARGVDTAIRPVLAGQTLPLILAANQPLDALFRSVASYPKLLADGVETATDRSSDGELMAMARPILDSAYDRDVAGLRALYARRDSEGRATSDLSTAAHYVVRGGIEAIMVDMDAVTPGTVDETTGEIAFAASEGPQSYGVEDQVAVMALASGAKVLAVRSVDMPPGAGLAATLRFTV